MEVPTTASSSMETAVKSLTQGVLKLQKQQTTFSKSLVKHFGKVALLSVQLTGEMQQLLANFSGRR